MAAIRSSAEGMASTGISRLGRRRPLGSSRFQKVALREKEDLRNELNSWRELRNELSFRLTTGSLVLDVFVQFVLGPNTDVKSLTRPCCWEVTLSRPKTSNGVPTEDGVASFSICSFSSKTRTSSKTQLLDHVFRTF